MRFGRPSLHDRERYVFDRVRGKRVVSIGLGGQVQDTGYSFNLATADLRNTFSARLAAEAAQTCFIDVSDAAIAASEPQVDADYFNADITRDPTQWPPGLSGLQCDVVVLGEVLEHLDNPGSALRSLQTLLAPGGSFLVTVPSAFNLSVVMRMARRDENVHPEHVAYYSPSTLTRLFEMAGLRVTELGFYRTRSLEGSHALRAPMGFLAGAVAERMPQFGRGIVASGRPVSEGC